MWKILKLLPKEYIEEVYEDSLELVEMKERGVEFEDENGLTVSKVKPESRISKQNMSIQYPYYPHINKLFVEAIKEHMGDERPHEIKEYNYLHYGVGGHFKRHGDFFEYPDVYLTRRWAFITPIHYSDDLTGGTLTLWESDDIKHDVKLKIGETLIFHPALHHQVNPVITGKREVLASWAMWKK